jgi:hypothetical protein
MAIVKANLMKWLQNKLYWCEHNRKDGRTKTTKQLLYLPDYKMSYFFFKFQFHLKAERSHIHKQFMEKYETGNCGTAQNTDAQTVSN